MPVLCEGIVMYDPRHGFKAPVGDEAILQGESVFINSDGELEPVDDAGSQPCHGWALEDGAIGDTITVVRYCRMKLNTAHTIGARVYTGAVAGGSPPSTTFSAVGPVVGWAYASDAVIITAPNPPAADG